MARLTRVIESDDDSLPEVEDILNQCTTTKLQHASIPEPPAALRQPKSTVDVTGHDAKEAPASKLVSKQRKLKPKPKGIESRKVCFLPALGHATGHDIGSGTSSTQETSYPPDNARSARGRPIPGRSAKKAINYKAFVDEDIHISDESSLDLSGLRLSSDSEDVSDMSEFDLPDMAGKRLVLAGRTSASKGFEAQQLTNRSSWQHPSSSCSSDLARLGSSEIIASPSKDKSRSRRIPGPNSPSKTAPSTKATDTLRPRTDGEMAWSKAGVSRRSSCSDKENETDSLAILRFSPPRLSTKPLSRSPDRPRTPSPPPTSPTKSRLLSPSKKKFRVPTPPGRPSLDNFWSATEINNWHDHYSPQKLLTSPRKDRFIVDPTVSPSTSPHKGSESPTKRTAERKAFDYQKAALAIAFLAELDAKITNGQIAALSASTGGVQIVWSKTLNTTAGRANWRRETCRGRTGSTPGSSASGNGALSVNPSTANDRPAETSNPTPSSMPTINAANSDKRSTTTNLAPTQRIPSPTPDPLIKHHAKIELAAKVITDEPQLYNTLAHEFCHLANYMISNMKTQPHGASFKAWGRKCSARFGASHGVNVTTKHSYAIEYKYVWKCGGCGAEFGRHSKSLDTDRKVCGHCKGRLVQIRPKPRAEVGGYAGFVKERFAEVRKEMEAGTSQKAVMEELGRRYRAEKKKGEEKASDVVGGEDDAGPEVVEVEENEDEDEDEDEDGNDMVNKLRVIVLYDDS